MKALLFFIMILLCAFAGVSAAAPPPKMRPYAGIGVLMLPIAVDDRSEPLPLFEEPGLVRQGSLDLNKIPGHDWIFGASSSVVPLIVMNRKGAWLRVAYDDAGREAWVSQQRSWSFQSWEAFFKSHMAGMLPGLQKRYFQVYRQPGTTVLATLPPRQPFKVLRIENDWAMVMPDQNSLGWLRWRDEDGRLLIGVITASPAVQP